MKYYILEGYLTYFRFSVFLRQTDDQTYSLRVTGGANVYSVVSESASCSDAQLYFLKFLNNPCDKNHNILYDIKGK